MTYEPNSYWIDIGKREPGIMDAKHPKGRGRNRRNILVQESVFPAMIGSLQPKSILEVGCGWGRMTRLIADLPSVQRYTAIDISKERLETAMLGVSTPVEFIQGDFMATDLTGKYDLVFACEVVMHIRPETVKEFLSKMRDFSNHYVVNLDYYERTDTRKLASHNFNHRYQRLYHEIGASFVTQKELEGPFMLWTEQYRQSIFVAEFK